MTAIPHSLASHDHDDAHAHGHGHEELGFLKKYVFSVDHKTIGIQFLFMGLFFFVVGGLLAMLIRWQLAWPSASLTPGHPVPILGKLMGWTGGYMPPDFYTMVFSMHATVMIFFVIIVLLVGTFGNYLIPLKIGAADMAFPFLNGLAFWSALPAGTIMLAGFNLAGGAAAAGWTSYPPLSAIMKGAGPVFAANILRSAVFTIVSVRFVQLAAFDGQSCWFLSLFILGFSSLMGAVNYLTTMIKLRCPGMTMFRMPLSVWALFITSILVLLATPVLASVLFLNLLDHHRLTSFFEPIGWIESNK